MTAITLLRNSLVVLSRNVGGSGRTMIVTHGIGFAVRDPDTGAREAIPGALRVAAPVRRDGMPHCSMQRRCEPHGDMCY